MKILIALWLLLIAFVIAFIYGAGKQNKQYDCKSDEYFKNKDNK